MEIWSFITKHKGVAIGGAVTTILVAAAIVQIVNGSKEPPMQALLTALSDSASHVCWWLSQHALVLLGAGLVMALGVSWWLLKTNRSLVFWKADDPKLVLGVRDQIRLHANYIEEMARERGRFSETISEPSRFIGSLRQFLKKYKLHGAVPPSDRNRRETEEDLWAVGQNLRLLQRHLESNPRDLKGAKRLARSQGRTWAS